MEPSLGLKCHIIILLLSIMCTCIKYVNVARATSSLNEQAEQVYVVYMGSSHRQYTIGEEQAQKLHEDVAGLIIAKHHELLSSVKGIAHGEAAQYMLYNYKHGFSGFSATMTPAEAAAMSRRQEVVSVFPSEQRTLHTTRSWEFLESSAMQLMDPHNYMRNMSTLSGTTTVQSLRQRAKYGKDMIIGVLDSGVWPESESFGDHGMEPVPPSWKGTCESGDAFEASKHCNRKLIGAKMYIKAYEGRFGPLNVTATGEYRSVRDKDGHGTHTASTAAGREVPHASALGGFGHGTASGGAPLARLAIYKVCWPLPGESTAGDNTCGDADMLAAFDDAIADGVHVLSISIGTNNPQPKFFEDAIAIGSLHALRHGILVSCSGGNSGPKPGTISNVAPWILTVAASSVDRMFVAPVVLGDGRILEGQTVTPYTLKPKFYPLILASEALLQNSSIDAASLEASQCLAKSLDASKVKGKIVLCLRGVNARVEKGEEVLRAGGAGMILANLPSNGVEIVVDAHVLPATAVPADTGEEILEYLRTTKKPMAKLVPAKTELGVKPSPFIAAFSSQGPNSLIPSILKPDISAPGLNILAAWTEVNGPTKLEFDTRKVKYNIYSGTSMSCPHVSGMAALLKAIHPSWSPAAIKSAIMTTASVTGSEGKLIRAASGEAATPFLMGAGELNPAFAADPGLVYDVDLHDYVAFLCSIGYNSGLITSIIGASYPLMTCEHVKSSKPSDLNLPSIAVDLSALGVVQVPRTVKNVGVGKSIYTASIKSPPGIKVEVEPSQLVFIHAGQSQSFMVKVSIHKEHLFTSGSYAFGSVTWSDGVGHNVRSPIVIHY